MAWISKRIHAVDSSFLVAFVHIDTFCLRSTINSILFRDLTYFEMASKSKTTPPTHATVTAQLLPSSGTGGGPSGAKTTTPTTQPTFSGSQFASLLSAIQDSEQRLDRKLAEYKADVRQAQDDVAAKAVNRVQPYTYKKKAHEEQARFNGKVEESIQEAQDALEESPALQRAQEALEKGAKLLPERQKLLKIVNRLENGWGGVEEFLLTFGLACTVSALSHSCVL